MNTKKEDILRDRQTNRQVDMQIGKESVEQYDRLIYKRE